MRDIIDIQSNDNALFVTGQCNNRCLMCCQPPVTCDDIDYFYAKNLQLVETAPKELPEIGITGGEPTLLGERLFQLIRHIRQCLPDTFIQVLSNGRRFADGTYALKFSQVSENHAIVGIPLHADSPLLHDRIAGVDGACDETMLGLYNLAANDVDIELRIVINRQNYQRLPQIAYFISKNLAFVSCVAFIAMEDTGFTLKNKEEVWVEPLEYMAQLQEAVNYLSLLDFDVALFNLPLCLLPYTLHSFAKKSISDWKTRYEKQCDWCIKKSECCGLFATSQSVFDGLNPFIS